MSAEWTQFSERLPRQEDSEGGKVLALEYDGRKRLVMWDWIPPTTKDASAAWLANGFISWMKPSTRSADHGQ